ncbi:pyridoxal phosphate-dependent aminotransferase [Desulfurispirillum indicum]|uniref:alanine transaminase n=1 Tax=Desulfurispirillum indicum (strain ATCC BAA-1389 / DSM 22839 / S5) TaxID=653733 RepID=E6W421_DESIS|nr:pyridoxal phosphate-dependent aminotransferase [Desulfurispirillum indicum]ADU66985.1 aminotransferase class I and II [Desulfurispirillum indicum S5]UCZ56308.1 pyridoxal phosphate-dependent aminotransferase [Desulfurispirillum indicum]
MPYLKSQHLCDVNYEIRGKIAQKSAELLRSGHNIIELNIGNPAQFGFRVPEAINQAITQNIIQAEAYTDSKGIFPARQAVVNEVQLQGIADVKIEHVFLGNGVSELILLAMEALLNPGDEVLIPSPDYPLWTAAVRLSGGKAVHYNCIEEKGWIPDLADMEAKITSRTKAIVVINPNNPTGAVYDRETLTEIVDLARTHNLILYSDEIYNKITYDGIEHIPMASLSTDVLTVTFGGLSKVYRAAGYRVGWLYFSGPVREAEDYIDGITLLASMRLCSNALGQWGVQAALGGIQSIFSLTAPGGRLYNQRNAVYERLNAIDGVHCAKPLGALYAFPSFDLRRFRFKNDEDFVYRFLSEQQVLLVQGKGFNYFSECHFRVVFLPQVDLINDAMDRLEEFLRENQA